MEGDEQPVTCGLDKQCHNVCLENCLLHRLLLHGLTEAHEGCDNSLVLMGCAAEAKI